MLHFGSNVTKTSGGKDSRVCDAFNRADLLVFTAAISFLSSWFEER